MQALYGYIGDQKNSTHEQLTRAAGSSPPSLRPSLPNPPIRTKSLKRKNDVALLTYATNQPTTHPNSSSE